MRPDEVFLVAARRVQNFIDKGHTPPAGHRVEPCVHCGEAVVVSAGAVAKMDERRAAHFPTAAICTSCMLLHVPKIASVETSEQGAEVLARNPEVVEHTGIKARDVLTELLRRIEK